MTNLFQNRIRCAIQAAAAAWNSSGGVVTHGSGRNGWRDICESADTSPAVGEIRHVGSCWGPHTTTTHSAPLLSSLRAHQIGVETFLLVVVCCFRIDRFWIRRLRLCRQRRWVVVIMYIFMILDTFVAGCCCCCRDWEYKLVRLCTSRECQPIRVLNYARCLFIARSPIPYLAVAKGISKSPLNKDIYIK